MKLATIISGAVCVTAFGSTKGGKAFDFKAWKAANNDGSDALSFDSSTRSSGLAGGTYDPASLHFGGGGSGFGGKCQDDPYFKDQDGDGCKVYALNPGFTCTYPGYEDAARKFCPGTCDPSCGRGGGGKFSGGLACNFQGQSVSHGQSYTSSTGKTCQCSNGNFKDCSVNSGSSPYTNPCQPGFYPPSSCNACLNASPECMWATKTTELVAFCVNERDIYFSNNVQFKDTCSGYMKPFTGFRPNVPVPVPVPVAVPVAFEVAPDQY